MGIRNKPVNSDILVHQTGQVCCYKQSNSSMISSGWYLLLYFEWLLTK